jgi:hypothetical protein
MLSFESKTRVRVFFIEIFSSPKLEKTMQSAPCSITVAYRGNKTLSTLLAGVEGSTYLPVTDDTLKITLEEEMSIQVEFPISTEPKNDRIFGQVFKRTPEILESLKGFGMRALNIPECLALSKKFPEDRFAALGQIVQRPFGPFTLYVMPLGVGLVRFDWSWTQLWRIPATRALDPLASPSE